MEALMLLRAACRAGRASALGGGALGWLATRAPAWVLTRLCDAAAEVRLRVLTWNVWFDETARLERAARLAAEIARTRPHVVALQELLPETWAYLRAHVPGYTAAAAQDPLGAYFVGLLARVPLTDVATLPLPDSNGRALLSARVHLRGGATLVVGTLHLERQEQLALVRAVRTDVLAGDFNWRGDMKLTRGSAEAAAGATCGGERLDRVLYRTAALELVECARVGTEPIPGLFVRRGVARLPVHISDHAGVLATWRVHKKNTV